MEFETIETDLAGSIGRIRLNRPAQRNAVTRGMLIELAEAAHFMDMQPEVRVVAIEGVGKAFCSGVDLEDYESFFGNTDSAEDLIEGSARAIEMATLGRAAISALENMKAITVCKVQGYAVGGGAVVAIATDLRVIADDAFIWIPEVDLGTPLVWGAVPRLIREIGPMRTKDIISTCRRVTASEALTMGLVSRVISKCYIDAEVEALLAELAMRPRYAIGATKSHVNAIALAMIAGDTGYADAYLQAASWLDPEVRRTAREYVGSFWNTTDDDR